MRKAGSEEGNSAGARSVPTMLLTMHTMMAAIPECTEQKINQLKKLGGQANKSGCLMLFLALTFGMVGIVTAFLLFCRFL